MQNQELLNRIKQLEQMLKKEQRKSLYFRNICTKMYKTFIIMLRDLKRSMSFQYSYPDDKVVIYERFLNNFNNFIKKYANEFR